MNVLALLQQLRFIGLRGLLRALRYTLLRDHSVRRWRVAGLPGRHVPGPLVSATPTSRGAEFSFANGQLVIQLLAPDLARVEWSGGTPPLPYGLARADWPAVPTILEPVEDGWRLSSGALTITVLERGGLRVYDAVGALLVEQLPPERLDQQWVQRGPLRPEEHLYGLGERAGSLNLRGRAHRLWNSDPMGFYGPGQTALYLNVPVYLGLHQQGSYLIFYENSHPASVDFAAQAEARFAGGALRYYVIPGPPERALQRYGELTGRPPLPPRWALGFHQSRWSYASAAEVRAVVAGFQRHQLPLQALHLDIDYMDGYRVFTVDRRGFSDLADLARDLAALDVKLVVILDPGVKQDLTYRLFREGVAEGYFCRLPDGRLVLGPVWPGWCAFPDFTDPAVRAWWGEQYAALLAQGVSGFWHDMNEPSTFATWGDLTLPPTTRHHFEGRGGDHQEAHNLYGLLMARAGHEALVRQRPTQRPFILSRSGWAGLQRYGWTWTGDTRSTWPVLRQTIATILGLSLSGVPYAGPDIGGFNGAPSPELYLRWLQLGALLPFFRVHAALGTPRREPWSFGPRTLELARLTLRLRMRLLPYLYTLAWQAARTGQPLVRPLFWPDPADAALWDVDDAFFLGATLLVAPVLEPGTTERTLTLPTGRWHSFWDEERFEGPGKAGLSAPLERIPLLVRAGSVLPLAEADGLTLHLYPPTAGTGHGALYSDAGDGHGPWRVDHFTLFWEGQTLVMTWRGEGDFPWPYPRLRLQLHGLGAAEVRVDGVVLPPEQSWLVAAPAERISFSPAQP